MSKVQSTYVVVGPGEVKKKQSKPAAKPKEDNLKEEEATKKEGGVPGEQ
jgi:hypothetical protein